MTSLAALIAQVQALDEKATNGTWTREPRQVNAALTVQDVTYAYGTVCTVERWSDKADIADADLIATYRSAAPVLAAALKDALEVIEEIAKPDSAVAANEDAFSVHAFRHVQLVARSFLVRHKETAGRHGDTLSE